MNIIVKFSDYRIRPKGRGVPRSSSTWGGDVMTSCDIVMSLLDYPRGGGSSYACLATGEFLAQGGWEEPVSQAEHSRHPGSHINCLSPHPCKSRRGQRSSWWHFSHILQQLQTMTADHAPADHDKRGRGTRRTRQGWDAQQYCQAAAVGGGKRPKLAYSPSSAQGMFPYVPLPRYASAQRSSNSLEFP